MLNYILDQPAVATSKRPSQCTYDAYRILRLNLGNPVPQCGGLPKLCGREARHSLP